MRAGNIFILLLFRALGQRVSLCKIGKRCPVAQFSPAIQSEDLLQALEECGDQLDMWISRSQANACLFIEDPAAAMQAAGPQLDLDIMLELEEVLSGPAQKLDLPLRRESALA